MQADPSNAIVKSPLSWIPAHREQVIMHFIHLSRHNHIGSPAWNNLLPAHEDPHLVHIQNADGTVSTKTVALFHQLRCIEILHDTYVDEGSHRTSELHQHCLNYIRQSIMCKLDMTNEPQGPVPIDNGRESLCRDWEASYREADRNRNAYEKQGAV